MKKRFLSVLTTLALCLTLLPTASLAEGTEPSGVTLAGTEAPSYVTLAGTKLESGKFYIPKTVGGIDETADLPDTDYLTYNNGTLTVFGTVKISGSAGLSFYGGTLTLAGDGALTIEASDNNSAVSGSPQSTLTTADEFSASIILESANASAVQNVKLDLTTGGSIQISSAKKSAVYTPDNPVTLKGGTVIIETTADPAVSVSTVAAPSLNVTAGRDVTITGSGNLPLIAGDGGKECAVTLSAGGNVEIVNQSGMAVFGPLTVSNAVDVAISGSGKNALLASASGTHSITASGTVKMESDDIVCSAGDANGLTITDAKTVKISGETSAPVVTGMTLSGCGTASVTRLGNSESAAPIASKVDSDIPVLLHDGLKDDEPQLLWKDGTYQKGYAVGGEPMEPDAQKAVYYEAGNGYVMFSQLSDSSDDAAASAILFNAWNEDIGIIGNLTGIEVIGENSLSEIQALDDVGTKVSFTGNGTLHTLFADSVEPEIADSVAFHGLVCVMTTEAKQEQGKPITSMNFTAYGTSNLPPIVRESYQDPGKFVVGTVDSKEAIAKIRLTVPEGATLTIPESVTLEISGLEHLSR